MIKNLRENHGNLVRNDPMLLEFVVKISYLGVGKKPVGFLRQSLEKRSKIMSIPKKTPDPNNDFFIALVLDVNGMYYLKG